MKKLLNTLYVTSENSYWGLEGETIVVYDNKQRLGGCHYIIWKVSYHLDIGEQVRH